MQGVVNPPELALQRSPAHAIGELEKVIGRLPNTLRRDLMDEQSRTHGDLTELLLSRATPLVTQQVTGLLVKSYVSPFTQFLLPIRQLGPYESINLRWMEINFDQGLAPQVEVEGLARLYTHNKTRRGARAVRRGVAVKIESGFFMTPEGRDEWRMQIEQLVTIIQRTNEYDVMMTLLQTPLRESRHANELSGDYNHIYGARRDMSFEDRLRLEVDWFSIVNKAEDSRGFSNLCTALRTTMKRQGVEADAIIVPPNLLGYYYYTKPDLWSDPSNRARAEDVGPESGIRLESFQGLKIVDTYVQRMVQGGATDGAGDLLTVPKQIGEFYPMSSDSLGLDADMKNYHARLRDVRIFNEDHSRMVTVHFADAIRNCLRWDDQGRPDAERHAAAKDDIFVHGGAACRAWGDVGESWVSGDSVDRVLASLRARLGKDRLTEIRAAVDAIRALDANADEPTTLAAVKALDLAVVKPMQDLCPDGTYSFASLYDAILGRADPPGGYPTGRPWASVLTKKSPEDFALLFLWMMTPITRDNMVKHHTSNVYVPVDIVLARPYMTYNASSVVVMKAGRDTGETIVGQQKFEMTSNISDRTLYGNYFYYGKAIVRKDRNVIVAPNVFIQDYVKGTNTSFITDADLTEVRENSGLLEGKNSMFAFLTSVGDPVTDSNILDIRGRHREMQVPGGKAFYYATAPYYSELLSVDDAGLAQPASEYQDYEDMNFLSNSICMLGHTEDWKGDVIHTNTGHLGPNTRDQINLSRKPGHFAPIRHQQYNMKIVGA